MGSARVVIAANLLFVPFAAMMLVIRYNSDAENYSGDDLGHEDDDTYDDHEAAYS